VRQLQQLQEENQRLKRLVADRTLDKTMLRDVLAKNTEASATPPGGPVPAWRLRGQ
jgi:putative transposase